MRKAKKPKTFVPVTLTELAVPIPHASSLAKAAELARLGRHSPPVSKERDAICHELARRLEAMGISAKVVTGFYTSKKAAGFHIWVEGADFLVDATADTFGGPQVYIAHLSEARESYAKD